MQHRNGRGQGCLRCTGDSVWLSLRQGTEPGREAFVEVFGAATTSGKSGNIGSCLNLPSILWLLSVNL